MLLQSIWHIDFFDMLFAFMLVTLLLHNWNILLNISVFLRLFRYFNWYLGIGILIAILYATFFQLNRDKFASSAEKRHLIFTAIIRYCIALSICGFGWAKISGSQFGTPEPSVDETLMGESNGIDLTWYYFAYSRTANLIIGWIQIIGSLLLLFRRTALLAAFILLPVMANILLINIFYEQIGFGALLTAMLDTTGLLYLILLHWQRLKELFFSEDFALPKTGNLPTHILIGTCLLSLFFGSNYLFEKKFTDTSDKVLSGKWQVSELYKNGVKVSPTAWLSDSTVWSKIYFEGGMMRISPNPYYNDVKSGKAGPYAFDSAKKEMEVNFYREDSGLFKARIDTLTSNVMVLKGKYKSDSLLIWLRKDTKRVERFLWPH